VAGCGRRYTTGKKKERNIYIYIWIDITLYTAKWDDLFTDDKVYIGRLTFLHVRLVGQCGSQQWYWDRRSRLR
jgi:hypothetical protein